LEVGSTLASTIAKINSDPKLRDLVSASDQGGTLKITSRRYGTTGNFTVESNLAAASDNSGIGMGSPGTSEAGVDVAGTINGEPATGNGQFLTGSNGNATTEGLQIQYTGTATGLVGSMSFSKGVGSLVNDMVGAFTDGVNGLLTATDQGIQAQIDVISESITRLQERLARREQDLRARFSRMEDSIARIQSQASRLAALNLQTNR
ncbi:MAG TPA: flagellar filament capping protein FliD, partial [Fimbriimonadaceae bacterium]|nr:flagellar filament capping protein FliD [Fimbriimonadaceae bacterium]